MTGKQPVRRQAGGASCPAYMAGKRDLRLDFLRGYALLAMTLTHLGMASPLIFLTGGSRFLINAAEVFFFISGFTIGFIAVGRSLEGQVKSRLHRAWTIYLYILFFSLGLTALFDPGLWAEDTHGDGARLLASVLTMKESLWAMDILIAYVIYVALSPLVLWGLHENRSGRIAAVLVGIYLLVQLAPVITRLEFASFRHLAANSPLFFGAIVLGYRYRDIAAWWQGYRWRRAVDIAVIAAGLALFLAFLLDYGGSAAIHDFLGDFVIREFLMPPQNLVVVCLYLRILWMMVTHLWPWLSRLCSWLFIPLGQDSLFVYCMQVTLIELFYATGPSLDRDSPVHLRLAVEIIVVGALLASVLLRRRVLAVLRDREHLARVHRHLLNLLVWSLLILHVSLILFTAEPGGWWRERILFDDF